MPGDYYREREARVEVDAARIAASVPAVAVGSGDGRDGVAARSPRRLREGRVALIHVYRVQREPGGKPALSPLVAIESPTLSATQTRGAADQLASRVLAGSPTPQSFEPLEGGSDLVRAGAVIRERDGAVVGVVVASDHLPGQLATHARRITEAYEKYNEIAVMKRPLQGIYLSLFLTMTLMILVSATWTGVYLAKRITRPVQRLAAGAREIGAGHLDHRIEPETRDEFGSLVEAFNTMAGGLAASQQKIERSRLDLEQQEPRNSTSGAVTSKRFWSGSRPESCLCGADGRIETINSAALRLLDVDGRVIGSQADALFQREDLHPLEPLLRHARNGATPAAAQEFALVREGRELHLAAAATPLLREDGSFGGAVLVFDDVTPLIRTQRVAAWRDVARRLAHEIKNPLTPIQLCAERMRRHFSAAPSPARELVEECTTTIVGEVESLKELVDEFAQFARMPAPRVVPADLHGLLGRYAGVSTTASSATFDWSAVSPRDSRECA